MAGDMKAMIEDVFAMISSGDLSRCEELVHPEYEEVGPFPVAPGIEGFKQLVTMFRGAFPDLQVHAVDILVDADGERAAWRVEGTGTHLGELAGIPATGKKVAIGGIDIGEAKDGKAYRHISSPDMLGLLTQLGVIPPLGAPASA